MSSQPKAFGRPAFRIPIGGTLIAFGVRLPIPWAGNPENQPLWVLALRVRPNTAAEVIRDAEGR